MCRTWDLTGRGREVGVSPWRCLPLGAICHRKQDEKTEKATETQGAHPVSFRIWIGDAKKVGRVFIWIPGGRSRWRFAGRGPLTAGCR